MHFVLHYDICAFILSAFSLFCIYIKKGIRSKQNKVFLLIIISNLFAAVADISSAIADMSSDRYSTFYLYFINSLYMIFHLIVPPLICFYLYYMLGFRYKPHSKVPWIIASPYIVSLVLIFVNPVTKWVFFFDEEGDYTRGPVLPVLFALTVAYLIIAIYKVIRHGKAASPGKLIMIIAYIVIGVLGVAVQYLFPGLLIELFVESIVCLGVLFSIENYDEMISPVTRVLNRNALTKDIHKYMIAGTEFTLITIRIKESAYITSTFGVENMTRLEHRIVNSLSFTDTTVYHDAGGSYALLCYDNNAAGSIVESIKTQLDRDWEIGSANIRFGARISSATFPGELDSSDMVEVMLDTPIEVNATNRHTVEVVPYSDFARRVDVDRALKRALEKRSFEVYYQPIFDLMDNRIHAAEALLRLHDEELGDISPEEFVPIAEKHGYIIEMGNIVLEQVFRFYKECRLDELGVDFIDINLSAVQCMNDDFVPNFKRIAKETGIDLCHVTLEITETTIVHNRDVMQRLIAELSQEGVRFSLDDFGTGYSNYSYILDYRFNLIKIDKSLLWSADLADNGDRMFSGMIKMFQSMNVRTLVEGVENDSQKVLAEKSGCNYMQGFYYSGAKRADRFIEYVRDFNS